MEKSWEQKIEMRKPLKSGYSSLRGDIILAWNSGNGNGEMQLDLRV